MQKCNCATWDANNHASWCNVSMGKRERSQEYVVKTEVVGGRTYIAGIGAIDTPALDSGAKNPNPKDSIGSSKIPMHLVPMEAIVLMALGLLDGAGKYGRSNYLVAPVRASIYYDAAMRHLMKWFAGEEADEDSGLHHMAHLLACAAIIVGAQSKGTLIDDRNVSNGGCAFLKEMTPHVTRLQDKHADKSPKHYTIKDND